MRVVKYIKSTSDRIECEYPAKWGENIKGLSSDIEFYEIQENVKPSYNAISQTLRKTITLSQDVGELLKIAVIDWVVEEKTLDQVIEGLNNAVGVHIDSLFPFWERDKHSAKSLRYVDKVLRSEIPTQEEEEYIAWVRLNADWCAKCRADRDAYEDIYKSTGVLPDLIFDQRPTRP